VRPVIVTTQHRGVFFGFVEGVCEGKTIRLHRMRNCIYWVSAIGGVFGLASEGPKAGCKIGAVVPSATLQDVTSVADCTPEAAAAWEAYPCHRG